MMMTDPIADFFTRIRNGLMVHHNSIEMPSSKMKVRIAEILQEEGFIKKFHVREDNKQGILKLHLKYHNGDPAIRGIRRVSKPGRRTYVSSRSIPKVLSGLGIAIITTSSGVITDQLCREKGVGGEVLGHVW
ncbi:MAG: 30S ribosomal protein S8 [Nitrospina sp.]|nr:30S ribosomal protein S8 [Nitrospina sp.]